MTSLFLSITPPIVPLSRKCSCGKSEIGQCFLRKYDLRQRYFMLGQHRDFIYDHFSVPSFLHSRKLLAWMILSIPQFMNEAANGHSTVFAQWLLVSFFSLFHSSFFSVSECDFSIPGVWFILLLVELGSRGKQYLNLLFVTKKYPSWPSRFCMSNKGPSIYYLTKNFRLTRPPIPSSALRAGRPRCVCFP